MNVNSISNHNKNNNIIKDADILNNFFTSVFQQAPNYYATQNYTIPDSSFILNNLFLSPISPNEIIHTLPNLSNSIATGSDDLSPQSLKCNADLIKHQLAYICNLSFSQGVFPKLLKNALVAPIHKGGFRDDPSNYRPILILTIFSKLLEKLFYNRKLSFINKNYILHNNQFGFRKKKSTNHAIANVIII